MKEKNKVTIIGAGLVGSTSAYSLIAANITEEIALVDVNKKLVASEVMDLQHSVPFWGYTKVKIGGYRDVKDSKLVVIAAGSAQRSEYQSRLQLASKNASIVGGIIEEVFKNNPQAVVLIVTNPVDVLTYLAVKKFPKRKHQIFGSGTVLDTARFRFLIGQHLNVNPTSVHAYIVGEHGDSEVPLWSTAQIGNAKIDSYRKIPAATKNKIFEEAKNAAYAIIEGKKATYYAIAAGVATIAKAVLYDQKTVMPVSHLLEGEYGIENVCLSLPAIVGGKGIVQKTTLQLSSAEIRQLKKSAQQLQVAIKKI